MNEIEGTTQNIMRIKRQDDLAVESLEVRWNMIIKLNKGTGNRLGIRSR